MTKQKQLQIGDHITFKYQNFTRTGRIQEIRKNRALIKFHTSHGIEVLWKNIIDIIPRTLCQSIIIKQFIKKTSELENITIQIIKICKKCQGDCNQCPYYVNALQASKFLDILKKMKE